MDRPGQLNWALGQQSAASCRSPRPCVHPSGARRASRGLHCTRAPGGEVAANWELTWQGARSMSEETHHG
jgi:hypothetical protein